MSNTVKDWLGGLISALGGAFSGCFGAAFADPTDFNIWDAQGQKKLVTVAVFACLPAVAAYLKRRPLPGVNESEGN